MGKLSSTKEEKSKNYMRTQTYIFLQKLKCPKCGRILAGGASHKIKSDNGTSIIDVKIVKTIFMKVKLKNILKLYLLIFWNMIMLLMNSFCQY